MPLNLLLGVCEEGDIPPEHGTPLRTILQPRMPEGKRSSRSSSGDGGAVDAFTGAPFPDGTREMAMQVLYEAEGGEQEEGGHLDVSVHFTPLSVPMALLPHSADPASASGLHVNEAIACLARRPAPRRRRSSAASGSAHSSHAHSSSDGGAAGGAGGFVAAVGRDGIAGYAILRLSVVEESTSSAAAAARRAVRDTSMSPTASPAARSAAAAKRASALRDLSGGSGKGGAAAAATRNLTPWGTNNAFKTMRKTPSFAGSALSSGRSDSGKGRGPSSARGAGMRAAAAGPPRHMVRAASSGSAASGGGTNHDGPRTGLHVMTGTGAGRTGAPPRPVFQAQGGGSTPNGGGSRTRMTRASSLPTSHTPTSGLRDGTSETLGDIDQGTQGTPGGAGFSPPGRNNQRRVSVAAAVMTGTPHRGDDGSLDDIAAAAAAGDISHRPGGMSSAPRGAAVAPSSHTPGTAPRAPFGAAGMIDDTGDAGMAPQGSVSPSRRAQASGSSVVHKKLLSMAASRRSLVSANGAPSRMAPGTGHALVNLHSRSRRDLQDAIGSDGNSESSGGSSSLSNNLRILRKLVDQSYPTSLPPIRWIRLSYVLFGVLLMATFVIGLVFAGAAVSAERQFLPSLLSHGLLGYTYAHLHSVLWAAIQPVDSALPRQPGSVYVQELIAQRAALNFNTRDIVQLELGSVRDAGPLVTVLQSVNSIPSVLDRITEPDHVRMYDPGLSVRRGTDGGMVLGSGTLPASQYDLWQATLQELLFLEGQANSTNIAINGSSLISVSPLAMGAFSPAHARTGALLDNLVVVALPASNATTTFKTQFWGWVLDLSFWYQLLAVSMVFLGVVFVLQFYYTSFASSALARIRDEPLLALRAMKRETLRMLKTDANLLALGGFDALIAAAQEREESQQGGGGGGSNHHASSKHDRTSTWGLSEDDPDARRPTGMHKSLTSAMPMTPPSDGPSFFARGPDGGATVLSSGHAVAQRNGSPGQNPYEPSSTSKREDVLSSNPLAEREGVSPAPDAPTSLHSQKSFRARVPFSPGADAAPATPAGHAGGNTQSTIAEKAEDASHASARSSVDGDDTAAVPVQVQGGEEEDLLGMGGAAQREQADSRPKPRAYAASESTGSVLTAPSQVSAVTSGGAAHHKDSTASDATSSGIAAEYEAGSTLISGNISEGVSAATPSEPDGLHGAGNGGNGVPVGQPRDMTPANLGMDDDAPETETTRQQSDADEGEDSFADAVIPAALPGAHGDAAADDGGAAEQPLEPTDGVVTVSIQNEALGIDASEAGRETSVTADDAAAAAGSASASGSGSSSGVRSPTNSQASAASSKAGTNVVSRQSSDASHASMDLMDLLRAGPPKKAPGPPPKGQASPHSPEARMGRLESSASLDLKDLLRAGPPAKRPPAKPVSSPPSGGAAAGAAAGTGASPATRRAFARSNTKRFEGLAAAGGNRRAARHAIRSVAAAAKGSGGGAGGGAKRRNRRKNVTARFKSITNIAALAPMLSLVLFMVLFWPLWGEAHKQSTRHGSSIHAAMQGAVHSTLFSQSLKEAAVASNSSRRAQLVDRALGVHAADVRFRVSAMQQAGASDLWTRKDAVFEGSLDASPNSPITDNTIKAYAAGETPFEILNENACVAGGAGTARRDGILTGPMSAAHVATCSQYENGLLTAGLSDAVSRLLSVGASVGFALRQGGAGGSNSTAALTQQGALADNLKFVVDTEEGHVRHAMVGLAYASLTEGLLELDRLYAAMVGVSIGVALTALALMVLVLWPRVLRVGYLALAARSVLVLIPPAVLQATPELRTLVHHLTATGSTAEDSIKRSSSSASDAGSWQGSGSRKASAVSAKTASLQRAKSIRQSIATRGNK